MTAGFRVDEQGLRLAAEGVIRTLQAVELKKVSDLDAGKSAFGHETLAATVSDFCDRWQIGVGHLAHDGNEIGLRLVFAANAYAMVDHQGQKAGNRILQVLTGADPAAM